MSTETNAAREQSPVAQGQRPAGSDPSGSSEPQIGVRTRDPSVQKSIATALEPLLGFLFGPELPVRFIFWDGSVLGPAQGPGVVIVRSADAVRRLAWAPGELGLGRAYVAGDIDVDGDIYEVLRVLHGAARLDLRDIRLSMVRKMLPRALRLGLLRGPLDPPEEESRPAGKVHSRTRDAQAISHHYDVGNDFYRLVLGSSMTYSCARFVHDDTTIEQAQEAKHDLICHKLGLHERTGATLLEVGCGWGSMALHAASRYDAKVVGITLSRAQAELAQDRVAAAGLAGQVEIRLQDYRLLSDERFDAISSVGMFEHVGASQAGPYFEQLWGLLSPGGRFLNHAISTSGGSKIGSRSFMGRYVFPDGELIDVGDVVLLMQRAGFEVRDVESLREHYSKTLHAWVANLTENWNEAVELVGRGRARVWLLYMAASANGFDDGGLAVHQVLGIKPFPDGRSGMPPTRSAWT